MVVREAMSHQITKARRNRARPGEADREDAGSIAARLIQLVGAHPVVMHRDDLADGIDECGRGDLGLHCAACSESAAVATAVETSERAVAVALVLTQAVVEPRVEHAA